LRTRTETNPALLEVRKLRVGEGSHGPGRKEEKSRSLETATKPVGRRGDINYFNGSGKGEKAKKPNIRRCGGWGGGLINGV